jgi:hypothetical protein
VASRALARRDAAPGGYLRWARLPAADPACRRGLRCRTGTLRLMVWRLVGWLVFALVQRRVALAGDLDRDRATTRLREGYARGQLTLDEFSRRTARALSARSRWQLGRSLVGLPSPSLVDSVRDSLRDLVLIVVTGAYVVFSLILLATLALTVLIHGVSISALVVVLLVWLVPTVWVSRLRRRGAH